LEPIPGFEERQRQQNVVHCICIVNNSSRDNRNIMRSNITRDASNSSDVSRRQGPIIILVRSTNLGPTVINYELTEDFRKKFEKVQMGYSGAEGKNLKRKISVRHPLPLILSPSLSPVSFQKLRREKTHFQRIIYLFNKDDNYSLGIFNILYIKLILPILQNNSY
jgi:hypothetical protein